MVFSRYSRDEPIQPAVCPGAELEGGQRRCHAKALIRSKLWDVETQIDRNSFPSFGRILADQIEGLDVEETEQAIAHNNVHRLY